MFPRPSGLLLAIVAAAVSACAAAEPQITFDPHKHVIWIPVHIEYRYSGKGAEVPLVVAGGMPFVKLQVTVPGAKPVEGLFLVDCPHPGTIIMNRPFVEQKGLLETARRELRRLVTQYAQGVNGRSDVHYGRVAELTLGPFVLREPVAGFSQARAGSLAQKEFSGILGAEILRRFHVVFDFTRERLFLEPNRTFAEPFRYDASGMRLRSAGADFREHVIAGVAEDSAASEAKLQEGDRIIEVDGRPAKTFSLGEIAEMLKAAGDTVAMTVRRGSQELRVSLVLRELI
jgi:hypothetical protein